MIGTLRKLIILNVIWAFALPRPAEAQPNLLIVPGQSVGTIQLGKAGADSLKDSREPDAKETSQSQTWLLWWVYLPGRVTRETTVLRTTTDGSAAPLGTAGIDLVRITSARFHTSDGLHVKSSFEQIRQSFPNITPSAQNAAIYDAAAEGIAFEFAAGETPTAISTCIAIMIHLPNRPAFATAEQVNALLQKSTRKDEPVGPRRKTVEGSPTP